MYSLDPSKVMDKNDELIEQLADQEHERWSGWMRYLFDHWTEENDSRWKQQMITPYAELPEHSKESDRKEARKTMGIIRIEEKNCLKNVPFKKELY